MEPNNRSYLGRPTIMTAITDEHRSECNLNLSNLNPYYNFKEHPITCHFIKVHPLWPHDAENIMDIFHAVTVAYMYKNENNMQQQKTILGTNLLHQKEK